MQKTSVLVAGAGAWGTALAVLLSRKGHPCLLWGHTAAHVEQLTAERENHRFLPGIRFPDLLTPTTDLAGGIVSAELVLVAVPSHAFAATLRKLVQYILPDLPLCWATKGFDASARLLHETAMDISGTQHPLAVLSGPSFAQETAAGYPTAVTVAANDINYAQDRKSVV